MTKTETQEALNSVTPQSRVTESGAAPTSTAYPEVAADQVRAVLKTIPVGFFGGVIPAGVIVWLIHLNGSIGDLWIWLIWMVVAHGARVVLWVGAKRDRAFLEHAANWLFKLRLGVLGLGLSWAALPLILSPVSRFDELLVATVIAAVCGAGVAQQSSDAPSALLFMLPPAIGLSARLLGAADPTLQAVGILSVLYFGFLGLATRRIHASFRELSLLHAQAKEQSLHDALTGLPNRIAFNVRLQEAIARARRRDTEVAVGYIDLDGFKEVNDSYGHDAGDRLLREVTRRWRDALRETELVARLGGDEFSVLIEDVDPADAIDQLSTVFERLHAVMLEPAFVSAQQSVLISMTMGVARFPQDGSEPDLLLRQADAAMYQLKLQKATRTSWWQLGIQHGAPVEQQQSQPIDPYGDKAQRVLSDAVDLLTRTNTHFLEAFYAELGANRAGHALLTRLDEVQISNLKQQQMDYLALLVDTGTTRDVLIGRARHVGMVHCLSGIPASLVVRASVLYRSLLDEQLLVERLPNVRRYRLLSLVESRLDDALQTQFIASDAVSQSYLEVFSRHRPGRGTTWPGESQDEMDFIGRLPGIAAIALFRVRADGSLMVEHSAGAHHTTEFLALFDASGFPSLDANDPRNGCATALAWQSQRIERIDSWSTDSRVAPWRSDAMRSGIRSSVAIPMLDSGGTCVGVLTIYSTLPSQFASPLMQQWAMGVQRQMETIWRRCNQA